MTENERIVEALLASRRRMDQIFDPSPTRELQQWFIDCLCKKYGLPLPPRYKEPSLEDYNQPSTANPSPLPIPVANS